MNRVRAAWGGRWVIATLAVGIGLAGPACSPPLSHRDAVKVVDPELRIDGRLLEYEDGSDGLKLGPYRVQTVRTSTKSVPPPASTNTAAPADRIEIQTRMSAKGRPGWTVTCEALRTRTASADYGAVLDESQDAVDLHCDLQSTDAAAWQLDLQGTLASNLGGKLAPRSESIARDYLAVEVLLWRKRFDTVRRRLPEPVLQVRWGRSTIAALVASREPQAWVATDAPPAFVDAALAALTAIEQMPLRLSD